MGGKGFLPGRLQVLDSSFYCGYRGQRKDSGEGNGFVSHHEEEWRLVGDGVRVVVVHEFGMRDVFDPCSWVISAVHS